MQPTNNCATCGSELKWIPAGISKKTNKPYPAFQVCPNDCKQPPKSAWTNTPQDKQDFVNDMNAANGRQAGTNEFGGWPGSAPKGSKADGSVWEAKDLRIAREAALHAVSRLHMGKETPAQEIIAKARELVAFIYEEKQEGKEEEIDTSGMPF